MLGGDLLTSPKGLAIMSVIADDARTESSRSECGHAWWKLMARAKSMGTHSEHLATIDAALLMHRQRQIESHLDDVASAPKPIGRKPNPPKERQPRKDKKDKEKPPIQRGWRKELNATQHGGGGAWRLYQQQKSDTVKGMFGGAVQKALSESYAEFKKTPEFADLQRQGRAATLKRATQQTTPKVAATSSRPTRPLASSNALVDLRG